MIAYGLTDVGKIRQINEDSFCVYAQAQGFSYAIVADGMGGHHAGEIASTMAVEVIQEHLNELIGAERADLKEGLYEAIERANERIYDYSLKHPSMIGMGTTVVVALADATRLYVAHVGDSRLYVVREGHMSLLTEDHSHVQSLVKQGVITEEEARVHPKRNIILRALGTEHGVEIDLSEHGWSTGDFVLLCSDGLSNMLDDQTLFEIVSLERSDEQLLQKMIEDANDAGGEDNITAVLLRNV